MALEVATYIDELVAANPPGTDDYATADDHLRLIKQVLLNSFPNVSGAVATSDVELGFVNGVTSAIQTQLNARALTARILTAGVGITGGGNLTADRTFDLDISTLVLEAAIVAADSVPFYDATAAAMRRCTFANFESQLLHDNLSGFVANEHLDHTSITMVAGNGLTGGGNIGASRTFNVVGGDGITANADDIAVDTTVVRTSRNLTAGVGITGGGDLSANRTFDLATDTLTDLAAIPTRTQTMPIHNGTAMRRVDMEDLWRTFERTIAASVTLVIGDAGGVVRSTGATNVVVTVPPNSSVAFRIGTVVNGERHGTGTYTYAAGGGVTIRSPSGLLAIATQYGSASLRKIATDEWMLEGRLG